MIGRAEDQPDFPRLNSKRKSLWQRFIQDKLAVSGFCVMTMMIGLAILAPLLADRSPFETDLSIRLQGPTFVYPLGTDDLGRSTWARLLYGARNTLGVAFATISIVLGIGALVGMTAGLLGGWLDNILMRLVDILLAFPGLILALAIAGMLGPSLWNVLIGLSVVGWGSYARVIRGQILSIRELEFIESARASGAGLFRIGLRHVLPHILPTIAVLASLDIGGILLSVSALSFLGIGAQAPTPEWGRMLADARPFMWQAPYLMLAPGVAIFLMVLSLNFIGDALRDLLDPQKAKKH